MHELALEIYLNHRFCLHEKRADFKINLLYIYMKLAKNYCSMHELIMRVYYESLCQWFKLYMLSIYFKIAKNGAVLTGNSRHCECCVMNN